MVTVMLPGLRGVKAERELLKLAAKLKHKYDIHYDRNANDEFEALYGILKGLDEIIEDLKKREYEVDKTKAFIDAIISEKGEITAEGVYVWPRHLKEEAEELGVDWEEFKEELKKAGVIEFDPKNKKYKVKL
ncbi:MAG: hypothetical protein PWP76_111 [Candidatus Diapherotrites archaeon]|nr:hypothetical protein [Candidatus Diapherotrites archaeon]MDN5366805.1 hypothetical protein [Candidatus Diapherotrites archaeon]